MHIRTAPLLRVGVCCVAGLLALPASGASVAAAQQGIVRGVVVDSAGDRIPEAAIAAVEVHRAARTDQQGRFVLDRLPIGVLEISVRRIGYEPLTVRVTVTTAAADSVRVTLKELPEVLSAIEVSATERHRRQSVEDFYWRRARGVGGKFFTREEILAQRASTPSDVLRTSPGVKLVRVASGKGVRFTGVSSMRRGDCMPMLWLDGQRVPGMEIDDVPLQDIEGIELYSGISTTPPQFYAGNAAQCGAIVVWSRVPGT